MKEVNVTELRNNLPAYLGMVTAGEELLLTSRGKKIARLDHLVAVCWRGVDRRGYNFK